MKFFYQVFVISLFVILIITGGLFITCKKRRESFKTLHTYYPCIYCLMVTGKNHDRIELAKKAIKNFTEQTYPHKKLVILNHNEDLKVQNKQENSPYIYEFFVNKQNKTLGHLRNILLNFVPINALWTTWDDDDIRSKNYLQYLYKFLKKKNADCVAFKKRIEYNVQSKLLWISELHPAYKIVLCKHHPSISYLNKDTLEDVNLLKDIKKLGFFVYCIYNDPLIYIRLNHNSNTSVYVQKQKKNIKKPISNLSNYKEYDIQNNIQKNIILKIINDYLYDGSY